MNSTLRSLVFWMVSRRHRGPRVELVDQVPSSRQSHLTFTDFMTAVEKEEDRPVTITGDEITGTTKDGETFRDVAPPSTRGWSTS